ncbi:hypothetical protein E2C01_085580 [Portunus trituberculatus]|uniref:Uncharacterized protein n=1 Tax=Portunus trituberculatus TaxID=210409 RepID=A0A5B7J782_PORTR|nr:hypothetical protein [Portunus trituberculatus]
MNRSEAGKIRYGSRWYIRRLSHERVLGQAAARQPCGTPTGQTQGQSGRDVIGIREREKMCKNFRGSKIFRRGMLSGGCEWAAGGQGSAVSGGGWVSVVRMKWVGGDGGWARRQAGVGGIHLSDGEGERGYLSTWKSDVTFVCVCVCVCVSVAYHVLLTLSAEEKVYHTGGDDSGSRAGGCGGDDGWPVYELCC